MRLMISGHRRSKLENYDYRWIKEQIEIALKNINDSVGQLLCYSGMADGVDLWFCEACNFLDIPYIACVPFEGQDEYMLDADKWNRQQMIEAAAEHKDVKNSWMVERADMAIIVWDGNKGGTHNVLQQLVEKKRGFIWINPVAKKVWKCLL